MERSGSSRHRAGDFLEPIARSRRRGGNDVVIVIVFDIGDGDDEDASSRPPSNADNDNDNEEEDLAAATSLRRVGIGRE